MRLHSWMSAKCRTGTSGLAGIGVFADQPFAAGELVAVWGGVIYTAAEIAELGKLFPHFHSHPFEVAEGFFMGSTSNTAIDAAERFNHSCDPNIGIKGQIIVLARRPIEAGEELTFDYETTDIAPDPFDCRCGTANCRQSVDGSSWRRTEFQQQHAGWFSWYIQERIDALLPCSLETAILETESAKICGNH